MIYLISDTHFGHDKDFIYKPRGYKNIYEHDQDLIKKWNSIVQHEDEIYHLGDVMLGDNDYGCSCLKQLKGQIHIIRGNHDTDSRIKLYEDCFNVVDVQEGKYFKYHKYHFFLSHYPTLTSNYDDDKPLKAKMINLCGHSHTDNHFADIDKGLIYHCDVDSSNGYPIPLDNIILEIKNKIGEK